MKGACPHDCPDTCAMLTTVDADGKAIAIGGDPEHPITQGFLCGKVSNYLDRVYSARPDPPSADSRRRQGRGRVPPGELGRGARRCGRRSARGDRRTRRGVGAPLQLHGHAGGAPGRLDCPPADERDRGHRAGADDLRLAPGSPARSPRTGLSPEVDPEEWPHARYMLVWGWNPMSTAPHLWKKILEARRNGARLVRRRPVSQPHGAGRRRAPAPAAGHRRGARARDDARRRRRRPRRRGVVPRPRRRLRRAARAARRAPGRALGRALRRAGRATSRASRSTSPAPSRRCCGSASARQRHLGAPIAYRTIACLPALVGAWRHRGGGCSYIPTATAAAVPSAVIEGAELRPGAGAPDQHVAARRRAHRPATLEPAGRRRSSSGPRTRPRSRPTRSACSPGCAATTCSALVVEQFMTDTARHADVILPATTQLEHLDALFSWGHHYFTLNEPAIEPLRRGEAHDRGVPAARRAPRPRRPAVSRDRRAAARAAARRRARRRLAGGACASAAGRRSTSARAPTPHAEGNFVTPTGKLGLRADWLADAGVDTLPFYDPPAEAGRRRRRGALPARDGDPEDPPVPQLDLRQPGAPALGPARALRRHHRRRRRPARDRGRRRRAGVQRPRLVPLPRRGLRRRPPGRGRRADGLVERRLPRTAGAARRPPRSG